MSLLSCYFTVSLFHHIRLFLNLPSHKAYRVNPQLVPPSTPNHWKTGTLTDRKPPIRSSPLRHTPWVSRHSGRPSNVPVSATHHPNLENTLIEYKTNATQPRTCGQHPMQHPITSIPSTTLITIPLPVKVRARQENLQRHPASTLQSTRSSTGSPASGGRPHRMSSQANHQSPPRPSRRRRV